MANLREPSILRRLQYCKFSQPSEVKDAHGFSKQAGRTGRSSSEALHKSCVVERSGYGLLYINLLIGVAESMTH